MQIQLVSRSCSRLAPVRLSKHSLHTARALQNNTEMLKLSALSVVALGYTPPGRARQPTKLHAGYIADIPQGAPDAIFRNSAGLPRE